MHPVDGEEAWGGGRGELSAVHSSEVVSSTRLRRERNTAGAAQA